MARRTRSTFARSIVATGSRKRACARARTSQTTTIEARRAMMSSSNRPTRTLRPRMTNPCCSSRLATSVSASRPVSPRVLVSVRLRPSEIAGARLEIAGRRTAIVVARAEHVRYAISAADALTAGRQHIHAVETITALTKRSVRVTTACAATAATKDTFRARGARDRLQRIGAALRRGIAIVAGNAGELEHDAGSRTTLNRARLDVNFTYVEAVRGDRFRHAWVPNALRLTSHCHDEQHCHRERHSRRAEHPAERFDPRTTLHGSFQSAVTVRKSARVCQA